MIVEAESGRKRDRLELEAVLSAYRVHNAALVVAKVDSLKRSSVFLHKSLGGEGREMFSGSGNVI